MPRIQKLILVLSIGWLISCGEHKTTLQVVTVDLYDSILVSGIEDSLVRPVLYHNIPDFTDLTSEERKSNFIATVLPAILIAKFRLEQKRFRIRELSRTTLWEPEDSAFYMSQKERFKADSIMDLISRMKTHPNSIILAQAAVESGWGTSRFFKEANNLFGIWSYRAEESRIQAGISRNEDEIFLRSYEDISESILDYFETIGRSRPYRWFRKARSSSNDIGVLLPNLKYYSERREDYVAQLKTIIEQNNLTQFDHYKIDPAYIVEE